MYSALKKDGKALYEYARAGETIERPARDIFIYGLKIAKTQDESAQPAIEIEVTCSKGTYIRTLAEDIGQALGCGAHLRSLRRTETGGLGLAQCVTLAQLEALEGDARLAHVLPADHLLQGHTPITLGAEDAARFLTGLRRRGPWADADAVAVYADQPRALLGVGHIHAGELIPDRLLSPLEIQQILEGMSRPS
jgi:tRNA pseudouridine55 synthase